MLIQSHAGYVELLPALPNVWKNGSVYGLKARGGFQVDMVWADGKLTGLEILSRLGNTLELRIGSSEATLATRPGQVITLREILRVIES
jgi:alpha-L-fucosidase 2